MNNFKKNAKIEFISLFGNPNEIFEMPKQERTKEFLKRYLNN